MSSVALTSHAVHRYRERVDSGASLGEARLALARFVSHARVRSTPRHWMRGDVAATPGLRFAYWAAMPHVCALIRDGLVVTVITRELCIASPARHLQVAVGQARRERRPALRLVRADEEAA